jgi:hypothetical protein
MVNQRKFSDVPLTAIPVEKHAELIVLLGEDIIIRRDLGGDPTSFAPSEEVINFTYDEFRDFLIAKFLIENIYPQDSNAFLAFLQPGGASPITEGVKRFLFYWSRLPDNRDFGDFYSSQQTYRESYPSEVFSVDQSYLDDQDRDLIRAILLVGDKVSEETARQLIQCWNPVVYPVLNLDILIDVVAKNGDQSHFNLISKNFLSNFSYYDRESPVEDFCNSIDKYVLPKFSESLHQVLFDFVTLLFPLESDMDLNSPAVAAFRKFRAVEPDPCMRALLRSLSFTMEKHRAFVWRLLAESHAAIPDQDLVRELAREELSRAGQATAIEISRLLKRISPRP